MTRVSFPDFTATSRSGKLVLEAASPDNADPNRPDVGFQGGFAYRLVRSDGQVIWIAKSQGTRDLPPCAAWISDDGWSVVRTHGMVSAGLLVISPKGTRVLHVHIRHDDGEPLDTASRDAEWVDAHCQWSTAGLFWSMDALPTFFEMDGRPWFCMRTGWGRRLGIDLEDGLTQTPPRQNARLAHDEEIAAPKWSRLAAEAERRAVRDILERRSPEPRPLGAALAVVGDERLEEMLPLLSDLAKLPDQVSSTSSHAVPSWQLVQSRTRLQLRWAIRRLGAIPPLPTGVSFRRADQNPRAVPKRSAIFGVSPVHARDLPRFHDPGQALERLGFPDYVRSGHERGPDTSRPTAWWEDWEYDMGEHEDAWTVRIRWSTKKHGRVAKMTDLCDVEPGWQGSGRRDELFGRL